MTRAGLAALAALAFGLGGCASMQDRATGFDHAFPAYTALVERGFTGDFAVSRPGQPDAIHYGPTEDGMAVDRTIEGWPWASVTKQVIAVLVMREVESGRLALDTDVGDFVPSLRGRELSVEDLLRHRSYLPNPDDSEPDPDGFPSFYGSGSDRLRYCTAGRGEARAEGEWAYNNCDYIVLGAVLERASGSPLDLLLAQGIGLEAGWINTEFLTRDAERSYVGADARRTSRIAGYGASASLVGPLDDMLAFDRALMEGRLLNEESMELLWNGDPAAGYMALGQWVFDAPLSGCDAPVRIVERRGAIGAYQIRNLMLPDLGIAIAMATEQADWDFGEIWSGNGASFDALSAVACD